MPHVLVRALTTLARARTLSDVTQTVRTVARQLLHSDGITFVLRDNGYCHYIDEDAIGPLWKGQRFPLHSCMTGWVMLHRQPAVIPDIFSDPRIPQDAYRKTFVRSMMCVPIRADDPIGALGSYWASHHEATPAQVEILQMLADAASVAMENVRLMGELREAKDRAEAQATENRALFERASRELSERVQSERARLRSQDQLSLAMSAGNMGTWDWDLVNHIISRSPGYVQLTGRPAVGPEPDAEWFLNHIHPEDSPRVRAALNSSRDSRELYDQEFRFNHPDGSERWIRAAGRFIYNDAGQPVRMYGILQDTTQRKAVELKLKQSEHKLRLIFEHAPVGIALTDPDGKLLDANPAAIRMIESASTDPLVLAVGQHRPLSWATFAELLPGEENGIPREWSYVRKDGQVGWGRMGVSAVRDSHGRLQFIVGMMEDITEQKRLAASLVQAQKMESIGRLAGGIAHDFNNALTVILGWLGIVEPHARSQGALRQGLDSIHRAADHAAGLTRQLLAFARRQILEPRTVDLDSLISGVHTLASTLVGDDVRIEHRRSTGLWPVKVDPGQIEQVILNLAANSRDAMPRGGVITMETSNVRVTHPGEMELDSIPAGDYAALTFTDTGEGIDQAVLPYIFEPFFTTKRPGEGTGLGLATVHGIVTQHGGHIDVKSSTGPGSASKGAAFRMLFPRAAEEREPAPAAQAIDHAPSGRETILLVEDEPLVRTVAATALRIAGYNVLEADAPEVALRIAAEHNGDIHLLLSDVVMPGMSGFVLSHKIAALRPGLRVILSSGYSEESIEEHRTGGESILFLAKPYTPTMLAQRVREALDGVPPAR